MIFFGTPDYVIPILESLSKNYKIVAVVTQPPKLVGRKQIKTFSPVDNWAYKRKIPIITNLDEKLPEANLGIVAAYGKIIPQKVINHFPRGILNIHPSLLPKYRGPSPIQFQILDDQKVTGVSIIKMDEKVDHGPIVSSFRDIIEPDDTNETLRKRLFEKSARFLIELIPNYLNSKINLKPQNEEDATFTKIIKKDDGFVDLQKNTPQEIERKFRSLTPWPGIFTLVKINGKEKRLKINDLKIKDGRLILEKVQLEGKRPVSYEEFKRGYPQTAI